MPKSPLLPQNHGAKRDESLFNTPVDPASDPSTIRTAPPEEYKPKLKKIYDRDTINGRFKRRLV